MPNQFCESAPASYGAPFVEFSQGAANLICQIKVILRLAAVNDTFIETVLVIILFA